MEKKWRKIGKGETIPTSSIIRPIDGGLPNITGSRVMMGQDCYYLSVDDAYELLKDLPLETEEEAKERNEATIIKKLIGLVKETEFLSEENRASFLNWLESKKEKETLLVEGYEELSEYEKTFNDIARKYVMNVNGKGYNQSWYVKERAFEMLHHAKKELIRRGEENIVKFSDNKKDVFIEKAAEWLANNVTCDGYTFQSKAKMIHEFKKAMEL